tara:strand:+ start:125 stop:304 length:180 start_codon:yes stop_codon:yes gene_type:complete
LQTSTASLNLPNSFNAAPRLLYAIELLDLIDIAFLQASTASLNLPNSFNTAPRLAYATS